MVAIARASLEATSAALSPPSGRVNGSFSSRAHISGYCTWKKRLNSNSKHYKLLLQQILSRLKSKNVIPLIQVLTLSWDISSNEGPKKRSLISSNTCRSGVTLLLVKRKTKRKKGLTNFFSQKMNLFKEWNSSPYIEDPQMEDPKPMQQL